MEVRERGDNEAGLARQSSETTLPGATECISHKTSCEQLRWQPLPCLFPRSLLLSRALWLHHEYPEFGPLGIQSQESRAIFSFSKQGYYTKSKDRSLKGGQAATPLKRSAEMPGFPQANLFDFKEIWKFVAVCFIETLAKSTQSLVPWHSSISTYHCQTTFSSFSTQGSNPVRCVLKC